MKSLTDNPITNLEPVIFTPEIMEWIKKEGFTIKKNDSYCFKEMNLKWEETCYHKGIYSVFTIHIYIFSKGIGADIDYDCGGNMNNYFWKFSDYSFEQAYDKMVEYVNKYKE